jgi:hypothetical protein
MTRRLTPLSLLFATSCLFALPGCSDTIQTHKQDTGEDTGQDDPNADQDGDGWTLAEGDCNDFNALVHPGAAEVACDGLDNDCVGGDLTDQDGDGYECTTVGGTDCADNNAEINPGMEDPCGDLVDVNCDRRDECDCDGDLVAGSQCSGLDCDDEDASVYPGAPDVCYDGLDNDCGGEDDDDCDGDGVASDARGGTDCDDEDPTVSPRQPEVCEDGRDNDCNPSTSDCDCDGDGYDALSCDGDDCDDSERTVNPSGDDSVADNLDNNCDGEIDEDAYCNLFAPFSNGTSATRNYSTTISGLAYDEVDTLVSWSAGTGAAQLSRAYSLYGTASFTIVESWRCDVSGVSQTGYTLTWSGIPLYNITFSTARRTLLPEDDMTPGVTWSYAYRETDATWGAVWNVEGTYTVVGTSTVTARGGSFDALVITNDYTMDALGGSFESRAGRATLYYVERLGLVKVDDVLDTAEVYEARELVSYVGFYP